MNGRLNFNRPRRLLAKGVYGLTAEEIVVVEGAG